MRATSVGLACLCACIVGGKLALAYPALGSQVNLFPVEDVTLAFRHCNDVASATAYDPAVQDFQFTVVAALNGAAAPAFSFQSVNYPDRWITIVNTTSGSLGIGLTPNVDDASWTLVTGLAPAPENVSNSWSVQSLSASSWGGSYITVATTNNAPCHYAAPDGDAVLTAGAAAARATWVIGAPPPPPAVDVTINAQVVTNPAVNKRWMGCHSDYGFSQTPRGFTSNLIYGSSFEAGTMTVPSWTQYSTPNAGASIGLGLATSFSSKPSMNVGVSGNAPAGSEAGVINRGIGGAGFAFEANQPYFFETWIWTGAAATVFVELQDFTTNTTLDRKEFTAQSEGPSWGSIWNHYNFTLTPSAATTCVGIPYGSDPTIDCGSQPSPAHICARCGGQFIIGLVGGGSINIGYVNLSPGPWGLVAGPNGPLPVLKSAGDILTQMGITTMRSGGSVSQSMRWKDWRGPVWNRPSQQQIWGNSLLSGWGPFEVIDMTNALGIEPILTFAYDSNDAGDWADLVEYCWGDASSTTWGQRRALDGHPSVYNITVFELGNEQYNPNWVEQVASMEARSIAVGSPPLHYMFPQNNGLNAADAQRALSLGLPVDRIMPDIHIGAGGAVEEAANLFAHPVVAGFNQSAINCETNAGTHNLKRALDEASDLIDFFTSDITVTNRIYARTASFCSGSSSQYDAWDQGISFFLPNMTWLQPPGYVHEMITNTWAEQTLLSTFSSNGTVPFAAQRTQDGSSLIVRAVNYATAAQPLTITLLGTAVTGSSFTMWTLSGPSTSGDNTPAFPAAISPVQSTQPVTNATQVSVSLPPYSFVVLDLPL